MFLPASFTGNIWVGFCLSTETAFSYRFHFKDNRKGIGSSKETVLEIFKMAIRLRDRHVFMWQSVEILNVFNTLILKQKFWKTKTFFKKLEYRFLTENTSLKTHHFHTNLPYQKPMLRQTEWWVQNGPITKKGVLLVNTLLFWFFFLI